MTTYAEESVVCGSCRHVFIFHALASTNAFGSADLDTRPPEMKRSTMGAWVQRCPSCGYCAADVSKIGSRTEAIIRSPEYRAQLEDPAYPELASTFLCAALLASGEGKRDEAGWLCLQAAWVLDDEDKADLARQCRTKAADNFLETLSRGGSFVQQAGASEAVLVDCLRRAGRGNEAAPIIDRALGGSMPDFLQQILKFQRALIERGDTARHTVEEAAREK